MQAAHAEEPCAPPADPPAAEVPEEAAEEAGVEEMGALGSLFEEGNAADLTTCEEEPQPLDADEEWEAMAAPEQAAQEATLEVRAAPLRLHPVSLSSQQQIAHAVPCMAVREVARAMMPHHVLVGPMVRALDRWPAHTFKVCPVNSKHCWCSPTGNPKSCTLHPGLPGGVLCARDRHLGVPLRGGGPQACGGRGSQIRRGRWRAGAGGGLAGGVLAGGVLAGLAAAAPKEAQVRAP